MYSTALKEFVVDLAVITTILQFLSGILVCKQYVINRTTGESSALPFICGFISAGIWLLYGLAKPDNKIILVNIVGVILMLAYVIVFYIYTFKKSSVLKKFLIAVINYLIMIGYMSFEIDNETLLNRLGISASTLTLLTIVAPMSKLFYVIRTKCTNCLPFPLILMSFVVSSLWTFYGFMEEDYFLWITNFIGAGLAVAQLLLFVIYPNSPTCSVIAKTMQA